MPQIRIGLSGWNYRHWRGRFYPDGLPQRRELEYASRRFNSIEINGSFYSLKRPENYRQWYEETPRGFLFAVKGSRFITHNKKLQEVETPLANFFASGVLLLREKLGPFVWQLPRTARFDAARIETFFSLLPRDTHAAARLAARHDARVAGRAFTGADRRRRLRHALEVRHESFLDSELVKLARRFGVAIVGSDAADWPYVEELTAGFAYLRLHGHEKTYASRYSVYQLEVWADRIRRWSRGEEPEEPTGAARITDRAAPRRATRDVYVYFDNDHEAYATEDALALAEKVEPHPAPEASRTE